MGLTIPQTQAFGGLAGHQTPGGVQELSTCLALVIGSAGSMILTGCRDATMKRSFFLFLLELPAIKIK